MAVAVSSNPEAESVIGDFMSRGYRLKAMREHLDFDRLVSVGLLAVSPEARGIVVDLMFASSGIEEEVVAAAEWLEVLPGISAPVATTAHLLALKTLAGREKDVTDFAGLATLQRFPWLRDNWYATLQRFPWLRDNRYATLQRFPWLRDNWYATLQRFPWLRDNWYATLQRFPWLRNNSYATIQSFPWLRIVPPAARSRPKTPSGYGPSGSSSRQLASPSA